jgi:hypothetical protein
MRQQPYYFEIQDMLTQFVAAFDNVVISRWNVNRKVEDKIDVRYLYSPKQRVLYDIINQAQNITLPVVAVTIGGITRDNNRVFNKLDGFYYSSGSNSKSALMRSPVPINITVNMSILTKFQKDMDQILSNFIPYSNPYVVISWQIPDAFGLPNPQEIRTEVLWNDDIKLDYPIDLDGSTKARVTADTSFTIKGWLFKENNNLASGNIYVVDSNLHVNNPITTYEQMSQETYVYPLSTRLYPRVETVTVSAAPSVSNLYFNNVLIENNLTIQSGVTGNIIITGAGFNNIDHIMLSSFNNTIFTNITSCKLSDPYMSSLTGQLLTNYTVINDAVISFNLPALYPNFRYPYALVTIVPFNKAGYATTSYTYTEYVST